MRHLNFVIIAIMGVLVLSLSSCSTSQKFTVQGVPGTIITTTQNKQLGIVDNSGTLEVKVKRKEGYMFYLNAKAPGSSLYVPFALDYKNNTKRHIVRGIDAAMCGIGIFAEIIGLAFVASAGEDDDDLLMIGGVSTLGGLSLGLLSIPMLYIQNPVIDYDYDYQKLQTTNNDIIK